jgi:hypothetical protein
MPNKKNISAARLKAKAKATAEAKATADAKAKAAADQAAAAAAAASESSPTRKVNTNRKQKPNSCRGQAKSFMANSKVIAMNHILFYRSISRRMEKEELCEPLFLFHFTFCLLSCVLQISRVLFSVGESLPLDK